MRFKKTNRDRKEVHLNRRERKIARREITIEEEEEEK